MKTQRIEITNDNKRAVFLNDGDGWRPDWFYEADRPMLRFKDNEWLSLGHVRPLHASTATPGHGGQGSLLQRALQPLRANLSASWPDGHVTKADVHVEPRTAQSLTIQREGK